MNIGHEKPASGIKSVGAVKSHLCTLAFYRNKVYEEQCVCCKAPCKYGMKLLELTGIKREPQEMSDRTALVQQLDLMPLNYRMKKHFPTELMP